MSDILLVHGSCHGAWCWRDLIPALTAVGHSVRAIDMPSHGQDTTPLEQVTLPSCAQSIVEALNSDTYVVGHSWAGFPISVAADLAPDQIARLIYLCAYAPWPGYSLADMRRAAPRQLLMDAVLRSEDAKSYTIDPAQTRSVFYHDCPPGTDEFANTNLCAQAILPQETKIALGQAYVDMPKSYIRCMDDRTIPPEFQVTMSADWPARDVYEMPTSHSPFFSDPSGLAALIHQIITQES